MRRHAIAKLRLAELVSALSRVTDLHQRRR
jgi:hypothetical protein